MKDKDYSLENERDNSVNISFYNDNKEGLINQKVDILKQYMGDEDFIVKRKNDKILYNLNSKDSYTDFIHERIRLNRTWELRKKEAVSKRFLQNVLYLKKKTILINKPDLQRKKEKMLLQVKIHKDNTYKINLTWISIIVFNSLFKKINSNFKLMKRNYLIILKKKVAANLFISIFKKFLTAIDINIHIRIQFKIKMSCSFLYNTFNLIQKKENLFISYFILKRSSQIILFKNIFFQYFCKLRLIANLAKIWIIRKDQINKNLVHLWDCKITFLINKFKQKKQLNACKKLLTISEEFKRKVLLEYFNVERKKYREAFKLWFKGNFNCKIENYFISEINKTQKKKNEELFNKNHETKKKNKKKMTKSEKYEIKYDPNFRPYFKYIPHDEILAEMILNSIK